MVAAEPATEVGAVVSRGGRPDLTEGALISKTPVRPLNPAPAQASQPAGCHRECGVDLFEGEGW